MATSPELLEQLTQLKDQGILPERGLEILNRLQAEGVQPEQTKSNDLLVKLSEKADEGTLSPRGQEILERLRAQQPEFKLPEPDPPGIGESLIEGVKFAASNVPRGIQRSLVEFFGEPGQENRFIQEGQQAKEEFKRFQEANPVASFAGEIVGGTLAFPLGGFGKTLLSRIPTAVVFGAVGGALASAGEGEDANRIIESGIISGIGGGGGEILVSAIVKVGAPMTAPLRNLINRKFGPDVANRFVDAAGNVTPEGEQGMKTLDISSEELLDIAGKASPEALEGTRELLGDQALRQLRAEQNLGVNLTGGQVSKNLARRQEERSLQNLAVPSESALAQAQSVVDAKEKFITELMPNINFNRTDRGRAVKSALKDVNAFAKENINQLYKVFPDMPGADLPMKTDYINDSFDRIKFEFDLTGSEIKSIEKRLSDFEINPARRTSIGVRPTSGDNHVGPLTFGNIENLKKRLNQLWSGSNPRFNEALSELKNVIDENALTGLDDLPDQLLINKARDAARNAAAARLTTFKSKDMIEDLTSFVKGTQVDRMDDSVVIETILNAPNKVETIRKIRNTLLNNPNTKTKAMSKSAWADIQAEATEKLMKGVITRGDDSGTRIINGKEFQKNLKAFGDEALKELFPGKTVQLKNLAEAIGDISTVVPKAGPLPKGMRRIFSALGLLLSDRLKFGLAQQSAASRALGEAGQGIAINSRKKQILKSVTTGKPLKEAASRGEQFYDFMISGIDAEAQFRRATGVALSDEIDDTFGSQGAQ